MILRRHHHLYIFSVGESHNRQFLPLQKGLDHDLISGLAEYFFNHYPVDSLGRLVAVMNDYGTFTSGQSTGLDNELPNG